MVLLKTRDIPMSTPSSATTLPSASTTTLSGSTTREDTGTGGGGGGGGMITLTLAGNVAISSNPLPLLPPSSASSTLFSDNANDGNTNNDDDDALFLSFVRDPQNRNVFVTAGGARPWKAISLSPSSQSQSASLLQIWEQNCIKTGASFLPTINKSDNNSNDDDDSGSHNHNSIVEVQTSSISFPGLQLESLAKIGIMDNTTTTCTKEPENSVAVNDNNNNDTNDNTGSVLLFEFVLLSDEQKVSGLMPTVWIFNKLTGKNDNNNRDKDSIQQQSSPMSLSKISYRKVLLDDDDKELNSKKPNTSAAVVVTCTSNLIIKVKFPKLLLNLLPTNQEKAELTGGNAITKALQKDVQTSMEAFEQLYLDYLNNNLK